MVNATLLTTYPRFPPPISPCSRAMGLLCWLLLKVRKLSTCGQHQGLPCDGTAWVSEQGPCCFLTDDLKHSWVVTQSCSRTLFPTGVRLISSCKGNTHGVTSGPWEGSGPHDTHSLARERGASSLRSVPQFLPSSNRSG